ncbi:MAG: hypothetical protein Q8R53_01100 [Nanoarchaeota archaeon]|nr:hypothetical protein [Nanoarchaeota archaeon]
MKTTTKKWLDHCIEWPQWCLLLLLLMVLSMPFLQNSIQQQPVLLGEESYYHLAQSQELQSRNFYYAGLHVLDSFVYNRGFFVLTLVMAIASLLLFLAIAKKLALQKKLTFLFLLFLLISPAFIFTFSSLSGAGLFVFLAMSSIFLLLHKPPWRYLALLPVLGASFIDLFTTLLFIMLLLWFWSSYGKKKDSFAIFLAGVTSVLFFSNWLLLKLPFSLGPFHSPSPLRDLLADLGGISGISLFILLLAVIGLLATGRKEKLLGPFLFFILFSGIFILNPHTIFYLAIPLTYFAAKGFLWLWHRTWTLESVKSISLFLILLGLLFSTLSYLGRVTELTPSPAEWETLTWIKKNIDEKNAVYAPPEELFRAAYFAQLPLRERHSTKEQEELYHRISTAGYIQELFPLLEARNIRYLFITPQMKATLPADQGLLFLLKNEHFTLLYAKENFEMWEYRQEQKREVPEEAARGTEIERERAAGESAQP